MASLKPQASDGVPDHFEDLGANPTTPSVPNYDPREGIPVESVKDAYNHIVTTKAANQPFLQ